MCPFFGSFFWHKKKEQKTPPCGKRKKEYYIEEKCRIEDQSRAASARQCYYNTIKVV
jgi:hypothetical protein